MSLLITRTRWVDVIAEMLRSDFYLNVFFLLFFVVFIFSFVSWKSLLSSAGTGSSMSVSLQIGSKEIRVEKQFEKL